LLAVWERAAWPQFEAAASSRVPTHTPFAEGLALPLPELPSPYCASSVGVDALATSPVWFAPPEPGRIGGGVTAHQLWYDADRCMLCLSVAGLSTDSIDRTRALSSASSRKRPVFRRLLAVAC